MTRLIDRNTTIPIQKSETFSTADDGQSSVEIHVLQGEREMAQFNKTLGKFQLVDIPPAPRGTPQIEVTFDIDANGIVHVSAKDRATGNEQSITITGQSSLDAEIIEQMVQDAEAHADEDRLRKEQVETRNNADNAVYQTEKLLIDQGEELTDDEKSDVEVKLAALKETLTNEEASNETISEETEALMAASQEFGQRLYEAAAQKAEAEGSDEATESGSDDDVVDAEIVDEQ
jgi:molecular chaperone DnaK